MASPGFRAGCGLKPQTPRAEIARQPGITRLSGRVRIETDLLSVPARLKNCITRLSGRVRIETYLKYPHSKHINRITRLSGRVRIETPEAIRAAWLVLLHHPAFGPGAD